MAGHLHLVDLDSDLLSENLETLARHWLNPAQLKRLQTLSHPRRRQRRLQQQIAVSCLLHHYLPGKPAHTARSESGKPYLPRHRGWHFNISHSGSWLLFLLSDTGPVGVDIEVPEKTRPLLAIARQYFSARELTHLETLSQPQQEREFYRLWTLKEAFFKARGTGIAEGLSKIDFVDSQKPCTEQDWPLQLWQFHYQLIRDKDSDLHIAMVLSQNEKRPDLHRGLPPVF